MHIRKLTLLFLLLTSIVFADPIPGSVKSITEEDGSPDCYGWQVKFSNSTVTDNQDGTCSVSTSGGSGAPTDADYLVGTSNGSLSAEIPVGTTPGGELGGSWASPTIDVGTLPLRISPFSSTVFKSDLSGGTGTSEVVFNNTPTITSPTVSTSLTINGSGSDPADTGVLRLNNNERIAWEASPTGTDSYLTVNPNEDLEFDGNIVADTGFVLSDFRATTPAQLSSVILGTTGTGSLVFNNAPTMTSPTISTSINLPASAVDAITEISSSLKTGTASKLATSAGGTNGVCVEWNSSGDLVDAASAAACGSGGSGDNITVNGTAATNADFVNGGIGWTLNTTPTPDEISASLRTISSSALFSAVTDETGSGQAVGNNAPTMTGATIQSTITFEQTNGTDIMTGATGGMKITGNAQITQLASCNTVVTDSNGTMACGGNLFKEYWWPASSMLPLEPSENVPPIAKDAGTNIDQLVVDFDSTTKECRTVTFKVPARINTNGTVTFYADYYMGSVTSGTVAWTFEHNSGTADAIDPDVAVAVTSSNASTVPGTAGQADLMSWTVPLSTLGWVANDMVEGMFCRNVALDTAAGDARAKGFGLDIPLL